MFNSFEYIHKYYALISRIRKKFLVYCTAITDFRRPDELWTHLGPFVQIYQLNLANQDILENMLPDPERPAGASLHRRGVVVCRKAG